MAYKPYKRGTPLKFVGLTSGAGYKKKKTKKKATTRRRKKKS